jgi:hypothetical protein
MQQQLRDKIEQLFEYRAFPELYRLSGGNAAELKNFHTQLVELQARIYDLDEYLETNWELKESKLNAFWNKIYHALSKLGIPPSKHTSYCNQIHKYQKHEADLRFNRMPTRLNMEYFYFYKSCDVKLQRRLLIEKYPRLGSIFTAADWRYFDLVTEVNDDACDLEEDTTTINGNRLLISFYIQGKEKTQQEFDKFINYVCTQSKERFKGREVAAFHKNIHFRTLEQAAYTKTIIANAPLDILRGTAKLPILNHLKPNVRA